VSCKVPAAKQREQARTTAAQYMSMRMMAHLGDAQVCFVVPLFAST
jgi:hypothetical protein